VFTSLRFDENWDALEELGGALAAVPGLELPEDWGDWKNDTEQQIRIADKDEVIDLSWSHGDWGNLSLILNDEEVSVRCEYDEDAWVGGRDGFHLDSPYYIVTEGIPFATADAIWAIPPGSLRGSSSRTVRLSAGFCRCSVVKWGHVDGACVPARSVPARSVAVQ
jgi:hypothetical protein